MILCNRIGPMSGAVKVGRCPSDLRELVHPQLHRRARASKQRIGRELSAATPGQSTHGVGCRNERCEIQD
jgi:hypothetical protein